MDPVRMIVLGAGARGMDAYAPYSLSHPEELRIVAVAEPRADRRAAFAQRYGVPQQNVFSDWKEALQAGIQAEAVLVATQDNHHVEPSCQAMELGYDVLLEKPIAKTSEECLRLYHTSLRTGRKAVVCHVLRYTRFFNDIKAVIESGQIGDVIDITHTENIGYWHMAHSFVRGNWRREDETSPMLLAKSCHDTDMLLYLTGKNCVKVASFGTLKHFTPENAPEGSAQRCVDCKLGMSCPYNALRLYMIPQLTGWPVSVITTDLSPQGRMNALKEGPYGRCVYHCDNDVVDHQSTILEFEGGLTATMTVSAFTDYRRGRTMHIMGSHGEIRAKMNEETIEVTSFRDGSVRVTEHPSLGPGDGHGGGDSGLISAFIHMERGDGSAVRSTIGESIQSHLMCIAAEESRHSGKVVTLDKLG